MRPKFLYMLAALTLLEIPEFSAAGTFANVDSQIAAGNIIPFAIVHPYGYSGQGGLILIDVCVADTFLENEQLVGSLQTAIKIWNDLTPATANCQGCFLWEEVGVTGRLDAATALLHELGHAAMGLGHPNLDGAPFGDSSFTKSVGASNIVDSNGVQGDFEDTHVLAANVHDVAWFRKADNNPIVIDAATIDSNTFSRSMAADLPAGHHYAASANRAVAQALGFANTQAVMYSRLAPLMKYTSLGADDVNMAKMAMTGADRLAGTADDYAVKLRYRSQCDGVEEIRVELFPIDVVGRSFISIEPSFSQGLLVVHWTVAPTMGAEKIQITLNLNEDWDFGDHVYSASFENGDLSEWSGATP